MNNQNQQLLPEKDNLLHSSPELKEFVEQAEKVILPGHPDSFWLCKPHFEMLIRSDFLTHVLNYNLSRLVEENEYTLIDVNETDMTILRREEFRLGTSIRHGFRKGSLFSNPEHAMIGAIGPGPLEIEWYCQASPHPNDILDRTKRLEEKGHCTVNPGEVVSFRALEHVFQILPSKTASIAVILISKPSARFCWKYDSETLLPTKMVAVDADASRLEHAVWALAELAEKEATPHLITLYEHQDHFIRWAAIRAVIQLDYEQGVRLLYRALKDPHPHVRNAARSSTEMLGLLPFEGSSAGA
jgi:hypothetical protein